MLSLQPRTLAASSASSGSGSEKSREDLVLETLATLKNQVPVEMDLKTVKKIQDSKQGQEKTPLTIVLYQEIDRYNQLLRLIHSSIVDLQRATRGDILRSPEMDAMFESVFQNRVPTQWQSAYPSTKALGAWTRDLANRILQLRKWGEDAPPKVFWLSGFCHPMSFLTALMQHSSRKNQQSFEALTWEFVVITLAEQALNAQPKDGAYIKGLWLEGARWDVDAGTLAEPNPMELYCPMPIIHFKPVCVRLCVRASSLLFVSRSH
jgi:dynein heavy chain